MLNHFRSFAHSFLTKILLALLVASFAIWGIEDMLHRSPGNRSLVTVGKQTISSDEYRKRLAVQTDAIRRKLGANYSPELLKQLNVAQFVLRQMVQESLLTQEAERIGFVPDEMSVIRAIRKDPAFLKPDGSFDKARFENTLRNSGISEKSYIEQLRSQIASAALLDSLAVKLPITDNILDNIIAAENQRRQVIIYSLPPDTGASSQQASAEELDKFYHDNKSLFTVPEYRKVSFIRFSAKEAAASVTKISSEQIEEYYRNHLEEFNLPEKRDVEQLLYSNNEQALAAYELATSGMSFSTIAKKHIPLNKQAISLGFLERNSLPEATAQKVFSLAGGAVTMPLESAFGWHIFRVASISPAGVKELSEVRSLIENLLRQQAQDQVLTDKIRQIEDALASGSKLDEIVAELNLSGLNLKIEQAGIFDKKGRSLQDKANSLPPLDHFVETAFRTAEHSESTIIHSKGGIYYLLRVEEIIPETVRNFAQAKAQILKYYQEHHERTRLNNTASAIENELNQGGKAADIIAKYKLTQLARGVISRHDHSLGTTRIPAQLSTIIFNSTIGSLTPPVSSFSALSDKNNLLLFAQIIDVSASAENNNSSVDKVDKAQRKAELLRQMQEEMMMQLISDLEKRYPVTHDEKALAQLLKGQDNGQDNSDDLQ